MKDTPRRYLDTAGLGMDIREAKAKMLGRMLLLSKSELVRLHPNTLRALWLAVCGETCDQLGGYHSDGCHQLTDEYWRRKRGTE